MNAILGAAAAAVSIVCFKYLCFVALNILHIQLYSTLLNAKSWS